MRLIQALKELAKRHWPALSIRTVLLLTFVVVAALPGVGAVGLRVYENTLVQQTEAELIAEGAVISAAYRSAWGDGTQGRRPLSPEPPHIDLRVDPVLPAPEAPTIAGAADPHAARAARQIAPLIEDASAVTLAATRLLDRKAVVVAGNGDAGRSYAALPEIQRALTGHPSTVLRQRVAGADQTRSPLEWLSRAVNLRVHHVRPVIVGGSVIGAVMLSRSPRGLFLGIYQDRGKIALGVIGIFVVLMVLAGLLSRSISRPIRALASASDEVARGRLVIPDAPVTAAIEIRELYANFATMAERIEARARYLRDFAAAVSHEFKTPLAGIRGALELLAEHDMTETDRHRFLRNADADAERLARLVGRLLDLARADMTSASGTCDAVGVARELALGAGDVAIRAGTALPAVALSADTLATVLTVLIDNSRQAGATSIVLTFGVAGDQVTCRVSDDGPGVQPGDRSRIFDPFFTGRRSAGGTGLGLPIARSLLAASGGTLSLTDSDRGAIFDMCLPTAAK
jgi:two-component system sensor histidine kinase ChvG